MRMVDDLMQADFAELGAQWQDRYAREVKSG